MFCRDPAAQTISGGIVNRIVAGGWRGPIPSRDEGMGVGRGASTRQTPESDLHCVVDVVVTGSDIPSIEQSDQLNGLCPPGHGDDHRPPFRRPLIG